MELRTAVLSGFALLMFAANSLLCRMALGPGATDAASYSSIRLVSGAVMLLLIAALRHRGKVMGGDRSSGFLLFLYAVPFSFAYVRLTTGTGALILFGCVQLTMLLAGRRAGERLSLTNWGGFAIASGGLLYLLRPGLEAPPVVPALLMGTAGIAWGLYSLSGRKSGDPLLRTTGNFIRALPFVLLTLVISGPSLSVSNKGVLLAVISGAGSSALGYVAWYAALKHLSASRAATLQLLVPIIAAVAGTLFLLEPFTLRLGLSAALVLGGVWLTLRKAVSE